MATQRRVLEAKLLAVLTNAPVKGWPADAQRLANRIQRYWIEWFTFLDHPEVKPAGLTQLSHAIAKARKQRSGALTAALARERESVEGSP